MVVRDQHPEPSSTCTRPCSRSATTTAATCATRARCRATLDGVGVDADAVFAAIATGEPLETIRKEHEASAASHQRVGRADLHRSGDARHLRAPDGPARAATAPTPPAPIDRVLDLLAWPDLNEFKHTSIPR